MELLQTADDIEILADKMRQIVADSLRRLPYDVQESIRHEVESFGFDLIISAGLTKDEVPYLTKCINNRRQKLLKRRMSQIQRFRSLKEDPSLDPSVDIDLGVSDGMLDKLYAAYFELPYRKREILYFFMYLLCKGTVNLVQSTADYILVERHAVQRALSSWKEYYANQVNVEVHKVRSIEHLRRLMYVDLRTHKSDFTGRPPESRDGRE